MISTKSPSLRGRGLKCPVLIGGREYLEVALFTRAWIEMFLRKLAPLCVSSPSLRGRGLKSNCRFLSADSTSSPSLRGRGLKCLNWCTMF